MPKIGSTGILQENFDNILSIFNNSFIIITDEFGNRVLPTDEALYDYSLTLKDMGNHEYYDAENDIWLKREAKITSQGYICINYTDISLYKKMILRYEYDRVTGLQVREKMEEEAKKYIEYALSSGEDFTVCMFDLDHFKKVNDTYLHEAGDAVLYSTSQTIKTGVHHRILYRSSAKEFERPTDIVGRYGGEEIYVLMKNTPESSYKRVYNRLNAIRKKIETSPVHHVYLSDKKEVTINVTTSIGAVHVSNNMLRKIYDRVGSIDKTFKLIKDEADKCLYYSKDHDFVLDSGVSIKSELEIPENEALYSENDNSRNQVTMKKLVL